MEQSDLSFFWGPDKQEDELNKTLRAVRELKLTGPAFFYNQGNTKLIFLNTSQTSTHAQLL